MVNTTETLTVQCACGDGTRNVQHGLRVMEVLLCLPCAARYATTAECSKQVLITAPHCASSSHATIMQFYSRGSTYGMKR